MLGLREFDGYFGGKNRGLGTRFGDLSGAWSVVAPALDVQATIIVVTVILRPICARDVIKNDDPLKHCCT